MKTGLFFLAAALTATASFAQTEVIITTDSTVRVYEPKQTLNRVDRIVSDFSVYVGFNNLSAGYELRPIGSRFVALAWQKRIPVATNGATKLRLITGPEIAWNNFMLEQSAGGQSNRLVAVNGQLVVEADSRELRKSKLVTTQLNLPLMLNVAFRSGLSVGAGAYAGFRLDSYTSVKPERARTIRAHGSYNLNPVRWGLTTELGFRGDGKLFFRYEPNSLFRAGSGPDASVWAVGLKL